MGEDEGSSQKISLRELDSIAEKLLSHNLTLTALELHTELVEKGYELPRLRDYFSNPMHFEKDMLIVPESKELVKSTSVSTFDSLDFARLSDEEVMRDGDDRIAVLEFELRKSKETINALRKSLTSESNTFSARKPDTCNSSIEFKPYEIKALNFLINEHLLSNNYKLTAITFADEIPDQDLEDWDDVGLNTSKPVSLLDMYHKFTKQIFHETSHKSVETDFCNDVAEVNTKLLHSFVNADTLSNNCEIENENDTLKERIIELEKELAAMKEFDLKYLENSNGLNIVEVEDVAKDINSFGDEPSLPASYTNVIKNLTTSFMKKSSDIDLSLSLNLDDIDMVKVLGSSLPNIVPNVLLVKRDELIPLLLYTLVLHPDSSSRDNLVSLLFNLIKKPTNIEQRVPIMKAFEKYAKQFGSQRVESELLPQCWEQINNKYSERRLLVIETCSVLIPYIAPELVSSLVLSMLSQMIEDPVAENRIAVVKTLSMLLCYVNDVNKFLQLFDLIKSLLGDEIESVATISKQMLLPCFSVWCLEYGLLIKLITNFINILKDVLSEATSTRISNLSRTIINESKFLLFAQCVEICVPFLFINVLQTSPFANRHHEPHVYHDSDFSRFPRATLPSQNVLYIASNTSLLAWQIMTFDEYFKETNCPYWEIVHWVSSNFVPKLVEILVTLDVNFVGCVNCMSTLFYTICHVFGRPFTHSKIIPYFKNVLEFDEEKFNDEYFKQPNIFSGSVVPIFATGILTAFSEPEDKEELSNMLKEMILMYSLFNVPLNSLRATFIALLSNSSYHDLLIDVIFMGAVHSNSSVKVTTTYLLELFVKTTSEVVLSSKILPAIITISGDSNNEVKIACLAVFGSILMNCNHPGINEKIQMHLESFILESLANDTLRLELVNIFTRILSSVSEKFRELFIAPQLLNWSNTTDMSNDFALALFEAFSALSCAELRERTVIDFLLPGLRAIKPELSKLGSDHLEIIVSLIRDTESKYNINSDKVTNETAANSKTESKFLSKIKNLTK